MKKILMSGLLLAMPLLGMAATLDTLTVRVKGMRCDDCAHKIRVTLRQDAGIDDISFNLERRTLTVAYDPQTTSAEAIQERLKATKRYVASPYDPNDVIKRGFGLRMDDMHCQNCADRIMAQLGKKTGIDSLAPHLDKHYMFIRYDANRTCKDSIRAELVRMGFTPVNYYTSDKVDFAYYVIPEADANQETIDKVLFIEATDDANVNPRRKSLAVTFFCQEISAEQLLDEIRKAGIKAELPEPHQCKEQ